MKKRKTLSELARRIASHINIPFTVGEGEYLLPMMFVFCWKTEPIKFSVNTAAFKNPELISELAGSFGSQCVVLAIDVKKGSDGEYYVYLNGGRIETKTTGLDWAKKSRANGRR